MNGQQQINSSKLKHGVFVFFFLILFAPMFQQLFSFVKEKNLNDVDNSAKIPVLAIDVVLEGKFQKNFEDALDINIGFRKTFVRIYNQLNYSLFNVSKAGSVVIGKNQYLLGASYIFGYTGDDFVGKNAIDLQIEKAKVVEKELTKKNVLLLFAFAPGKGSYYPEYIPDDYLKNYIPDSTNYAYYKKACLGANLNVVDLRDYFLSIKNKTPHPLFPQVGVHWSDYAAFLAVDTIARKIEELKKIKMRNLFLSSAEYRDTLKKADRDVEKMMNLFYDLPTHKMAYLKLRFSNDSLSVKPNLLAIADSYFSTIVATGCVDSLFSNWDYWLYNEYETKNRSNKEYDFKEDIEKRDVILLLATDATLCLFPYNFINEVYEVYAPKDSAYYNLKNKEFRAYIFSFLNNVEKDKRWKYNLKKSAKEKNRSFTDECILNATWLYQQNEIKNKFFAKKYASK